MRATYRARPVEERLVRTLGPVTLLYDRRSGVTHLLTDPAPQILAALADLGAGDARVVAARLAEAFELAVGEEGAAGEDAAAGDHEAADAVALVEERLAELAALGLIARDRA